MLLFELLLGEISTSTGYFLASGPQKKVLKKVASLVVSLISLSLSLFPLWSKHWWEWIFLSFQMGTLLMEDAFFTVATGDFWQDSSTLWLQLLFYHLEQRFCLNVVCLAINNTKVSLTADYIWLLWPFHEWLLYWLPLRFVVNCLHSLILLPSDCSQEVLPYFKRSTKTGTACPHVV